MEATVVIPARLQSSRYPKKILSLLDGKPLLLHVLERVSAIVPVSSIFALVDDQLVYDCVSNWGFRSIMTSTDCTSGTERIVSVRDQIPGDFIINVQADEPFISLDLIKDIVHEASVSEELIYTACYPITSTEQLNNPNRVKVVMDKHSCAMYFSRSAIPYVRDNSKEEFLLQQKQFFGHIGIYGYKRSFLDVYPALLSSKFEHIECLEQLKFLENQYKIKVIHTKHESFGIDTPEDMSRAEQMIKNQLI